MKLDLPNCPQLKFRQNASLCSLTRYIHTTLYVTHMSDEDVDVRLKVKEIIKQASP